jgi:hypothetical protein
MSFFIIQKCGRFLFRPKYMPKTLLPLPAEKEFSMKKIHAALLGLLIFAAMSFAVTCGDLPSEVTGKLSGSLCDSIAAKQDNEFLQIEIAILGLPDPISPPKGADSLEIQRWKDSILAPWYIQNDSVLSFRMDTFFLAGYDLRDVEDTNIRLVKPTTVTNVMMCSAKKNEIISITKFPYLEIIEPYFKSIWVKTSPSNTRSPSFHPTISKVEYFTIAGKKIANRDYKKNYPYSEIVIAKQTSSNGKIAYKTCLGNFSRKP